MTEARLVEAFGYGQFYFNKVNEPQETMTVLREASNNCHC
jgi:serine protease inhibitor ecotin